MSEPLENEIEEELRKKQLKALWDRFGLYLIAVILIIIMSFGGYEFSKYLGYKNSESASDQYEKALAVLDDENNSGAIDIFESLVNESNGYCGLSFFACEQEFLSTLCEYNYIFFHMHLRSCIDRGHHH